MAKETIQIQVSPRKSGKSAAHQVRKGHKVPGVIYGPKVGNIPVAIDELSVRRYSGHKYESTIFELTSDDSGLNTMKVLFKDVQKNPATQRVVHVDFYALDMSSTVRLNVEIRLTGEPIGVKSEGGLLSQVLRDIEVECLPTAIPDAIVVDVSELALNQSLHISDLKFAEGVKPITAGDRTIATVTAAQEEAATPAPAAAAPAAAAPAAGAKAPAAGAKK